jgi:hypothetical protein
MDSGDFAELAAYYKAYEPGGPRTPEEEREDYRMWSLYCMMGAANGAETNLNSCLFFPMEQQPDDPDRRARNAAKILEIFAGANAHKAPGEGR